MKKTRRCDLLIVGGGLAGLAAASALRGYPGRLLLVGRQAPGQDPAPRNQLDRRNIALSENSRRILITLGAWAALESEASPVRTIHVSEQGAFGVTRIRADEEGLPALGWIVPAWRLQRALYQSLQNQKNLVCKMPAAARDPAVGDDRTLASLTVNEKDQTSRIDARLLILADGGQADLHQQAGFSSRQIDYRQTALVFNMTVEAGMQQRAYERFTKDGLLALLPAAQNRCGVVWVSPHARAEALTAMNRTQFRRELRELIGDRLGGISEIGPCQRHPLVLRWTTSVCRGRAVLLGNAAHTLHPVAAQGFNLSLRDTGFLAEHLMQRRQDPGHSGNQARYQKQRRWDSRRVIAFTHGLIRFFALPLRPLRGGLLCTLDLLPPLRRAVVRNSLGLTPLPSLIPDD